MKTTYEQKGVQYVRKKEHDEEPVQNVLLLDVDGSLTNQRLIHQVEDQYNEAFARRWKLRRDVFDLVRKGDVATRKIWFDIAATPLMFPLLLGADYQFDVDTMHAMLNDWLEDLDEREHKIVPFDHADYVLQEIKLKYGLLRGDKSRTLLLGFTDCPTHLAACKRLRYGGFLGVLDGVIGMAAHIPDELRRGPYAGLVALLEDYYKRQYKTLPPNLQYLLELQQEAAKPSAAGPLSLLSQFNLAKDVRIVVLDDRWSKGGKAAVSLREKYPHTYFVLTDCEEAEAETDETPPISWRVGRRSFSDLGPIVDEAFADVPPLIA